MNDRLLRPDAAIISTIFTESQPTFIEILANSFTNCTFKAGFDQRPAVIVRLDTSSGLLAVVAAIQKAASLQISTFVPEILTSGEATTADGRAVEYTITRFVSETVTLESVWPSPSLAQKTNLIDAVANTLDKLRQFDTSHALAQQVLSNTPLIQSGEKVGIGGPSIGFAKDIFGLIMLFVAKHQSKSFATSFVTDTLDGNGIIIRSALPELSEIHLSAHDLDVLKESVVLSHNDLEPRNLLVKREESKDGPQYELAAIIDWEMAGLYPSSFETAVKDISLGNCNQYLDWYLMFKERTRAIIFGEEAPEKLVKAVHLIAESRTRQQTMGVSAEIRRRWIVREDLKLSDNVLEGWMPKTIGDSVKRVSRPFSKEDNDELEQQVLKDLGKI